MTWRGAVTPKDRILACLPYLLPILDVLSFGFHIPFFNQFPVLQPVLLPLVPLVGIYRGVPFLGLIIFFALFLLVVRNDKVSRFIRFNTMQAILLTIVLFLCSIIINYVLLPVLQGGLILETLFNVVFLGTIAAVGYSVVQTALGRYAEIPTLSAAVHMQVGNY